MRDLDTLRLSGRSRRVDHVGKLLRVAVARWRGSRKLGDLRPVAVEADHLEPTRRQRVYQPLLCEHDRRLGALEHESLALDGVRGIDWHVCPAGLQGSDQADEHLKRALDTDPHQHAWSHAQTHQVVRELVCASVQLPIGEPLIATLDGDGIGCPLNLILNQVVKAALRVGRDGLVPVEQQRATFALGQDRQPADRLVHVGLCRLEHRAHVLVQLRDRGTR